MAQRYNTMSNLSDRMSIALDARSWGEDAAHEYIYSRDKAGADAVYEPAEACEAALDAALDEFEDRVQDGNVTTDDLDAAKAIVADAWRAGWQNVIDNDRELRQFAAEGI